MIILKNTFNNFNKSSSGQTFGRNPYYFNSSKYNSLNTSALNTLALPSFITPASPATNFPLLQNNPNLASPIPRLGLLQILLGGAAFGGTALVFTIKKNSSQINPSNKASSRFSDPWSYTNAATQKYTPTSSPTLAQPKINRTKQQAKPITKTKAQNKTALPNNFKPFASLRQSFQGASGKAVSIVSKKWVRLTAAIVTPIAALSFAFTKGAFEGLRLPDNPSLNPLELINGSNKSSKIQTPIVSTSSSGDARIKTNVLVYGNGLSGITLALESKRLNPSLKVILVRAEQEKELYGEIGQSLLAYWDKNKSSSGDSAIIKLILTRAGVEEGSVSVNPTKLDWALRTMLSEAGVEVYHGVSKITPELKNGKIESVSFKTNNSTKELVIAANHVIDGSENANLAREIPEIKFEGLESIDSKLANSTLGVSPMLVLTNVTINDLVNMEETIRKKTRTDPPYKAKLEAVISNTYLKNKAEELIAAFDNKDGKPYLTKGAMDMKSLLIPAAFHEKFNLPMELSSNGRLEAGNIAQFTHKEGTEGEVKTISYNGLVFSLPMNEVQKLIKEGGLTGAKPTPVMIERLQQLELFFKEYIPKAKLIIPQTLYIRHSGNVSERQVVKPLTLQTVLDNKKEDKELGEFCYPLDNRGLKEPIKFPVDDTVCFEGGIGHALLSNINNLAIVSRSSGYATGAVFAGRIISANMLVAGNLSNAIVQAEIRGVPLNTIKREDLLPKKSDIKRSPKL